MLMLYCRILGFFGAVIMSVRFVGTRVAAIETKAKIGMEETGSSRIPREYGTRANFEDTFRRR